MEFPSPLKVAGVTHVDALMHVVHEAKLFETIGCSSVKLGAARFRLGRLPRLEN